MKNQVFLRNTDFFISSRREDKETLCKELNTLLCSIVEKTFDVEINENTNLHIQDVSIPLYDGIKRIMEGIDNVDMDALELIAYRIQGVICKLFKLRKQGFDIKYRHVEYFEVGDTKMNPTALAIPKECDGEYFATYTGEMNVYSKFILDEIIK